MSNDHFDLKALLGHFQDIGQQIWGLILDTEKLKDIFRPIKEKKEKLSQRHLEIFKNDPAFPSWWKMPQVSASELDKFSAAFDSMKPHDENLISQLFDVFKNIEIVSCILCFIEPRQYAIFSAPVENLLNIRGKNLIEKYVNYLRDLEEIGEAYNFTMIADVDHALWALANIINSDRLRNKAPYDQFYEEYKSQPNIIKTMAAQNSMQQIWNENPLYLDLARLFLEEDDVILAGLIASRELEFVVKRLCKNNGVKLSYKIERGIYWLNMPEISAKLRIKKAINRLEEDAANKYKDLRNLIVHGSEEAYKKKEEIAELIDWLEKMSRKYNIRMEATSRH